MVGSSREPFNPASSATSRSRPARRPRRMATTPLTAWQLGTWLRRCGLLSLASCCDLCGGSSRLGRHSENYADIERATTVCGGCHFAIHKRFRDPAAWLQKLSALPDCPEWAIALSLTPIDLPGWLCSTGVPVDPFRELRRRFPNDCSIESAANRHGQAGGAPRRSADQGSGGQLPRSDLRLERRRERRPECAGSSGPYLFVGAGPPASAIEDVRHHQPHE